MKILLLGSILALTIAGFGGCSQKAPTTACDIYPNCVPSTTCASACVPCR